MQRTLRTNLMLSGLGSWNSPVALVELKLEISPTKISDKKKQEPKLDLRNCNAVECRLIIGYIVVFRLGSYCELEVG